MASRIECITKPDVNSSHEAILNVGGSRANGGRFYISRTECANDIRLGRESYYVHVGGYQIDVTAYERNGTWYIRTSPDATQKDNLLSLKQCG